MQAHEMKSLLTQLCHNAAVPLTALGLAVTMTACYAAPPLPDKEVANAQQNLAIDCSDNVDNNQNGLTDCLDPACAAAPNCQAKVEEAVKSAE